MATGDTEKVDVLNEFYINVVEEDIVNKVDCNAGKDIGSFKVDKGGTGG